MVKRIHRPKHAEIYLSPIQTNYQVSFERFLHIKFTKIHLYIYIYIYIYIYCCVPMHSLHYLNQYN